MGWRKEGKWLIYSYKKHSQKISGNLKELDIEVYSIIEYYKVIKRRNKKYFRKWEGRGVWISSKAMGVYKSIANINREKLEAILLKSEIWQGCLLPPNLFNIILKVLPRAMRHPKEMKGIQNGKEEAKVSLFADDMIIYISNPKILLGNIFNKVAGYKINPQRHSYPVSKWQMDWEKSGKQQLSIVNRRNNKRFWANSKQIIKRLVW